MKIIYKYSISLNILKNKAEYELREHKITIDSETEKLILFFDGRSRKLHRSKLNQIDTIFDEKSYDFLSYYIYCWEESTEECKEKLMRQIKLSLEKRREALTLLSDAFEIGYKFREMKQYDRD